MRHFQSISVKKEIFLCIFLQNSNVAYFGNLKYSISTNETQTLGFKSEYLRERNLVTEKVACLLRGQA